MSLMMIAAAAASLARFVELVGGTINSSEISGTATAILEFRANGEEWHQNTSGNAKAGDWLVTGTADQYEVRATLTGGDPLASGTLDTWTNMNASNLWSQSRSVPGAFTSNLLIEVRLAVNGDLVASDNYTLRAEIIV